MATIKVILRVTSSSSAEGSLFYRIIHKRKVRQVHSGHRLSCREWDADNEKVIMPSDSSRTDFLHAVQCNLDERVARFRRIASCLDVTGEDYTVDDVTRKFLTSDTAVGYISYSRKLISDLRKIGKARLADHYTTALNRFMRFNGGEDVLFDDFDADLMEKFECHLKEGRICLNSISYYMRNLRAIYNKAVESGLADSRNPFRHVYTGVARTVKRAVAVDVVKALRAMDLRGDDLSELARDLFMFSFYTRGMAIIDVAFLRKADLRDGILTYRRQKTGQRLSIRWEPQMQEIVNRHGDKDSDFLFPLIDSGMPDHRKQYQKAYTRLNRHLKAIGRRLGLDTPLTYHRSRHSWASIARENNVPLSVICEGMGHDSEKTTRIYLASLDSSVVDKANSYIMKLLEK